jgi:hypothetical protein
VNTYTENTVGKKEVLMSIPMLNKLYMNGYDVLSVNNGPWRVCTQGDRLASFTSREEAMAYAAALPGYKKRSRPVQSHKVG